MRRCMSASNFCLFQRPSAICVDIRYGACHQQWREAQRQVPALYWPMLSGLQHPQEKRKPLPQLVCLGMHSMFDVFYRKEIWTWISHVMKVSYCEVVKCSITYIFSLKPGIGKRVFLTCNYRAIETPCKGVKDLAAGERLGRKITCAPFIPHGRSLKAWHHINVSA